MEISKDKIDSKKKEIASLELKIREAENDSLVIKGKLDSTKEQLANLEKECMEKFNVPADQLEETVQSWLKEVEVSFGEINALFTQPAQPAVQQQPDPTLQQSSFSMYESTETGGPIGGF